RAVEVNRLAPLVLVAVREVVLGELLQVVAVRPEMVVNHVQDDAQAGGVGAIDEAAEVVGAAIYPRGRKEIDAVVAPAKSSKEIGDRHAFEHRDAGGRQLRQFTPGRFPGALARERAHVHLVDYLPFKSGPVPAAVRPAKRAGIDELRRPVRPLWVEPRHWI